MQFLFVTDLHLKDIPPSSRVDDYKESILSKLQQVMQVANKIGAYTVIGGDLFSIKDSARVSHSLVRKVTSLLQEFDKPPYLVIGNHDIPYDNLDFLERQPIGNVIQSGAVHWSGAVSEPLGGRADRMAQPREGFIFEEDGFKVRLRLWDYVSPFKVSLKDNMADYFMMPGREEGLYQVLATHFNFTVNSDKFYNEPAIPYSRMFGSSVDVLLNGHIHDLGKDAVVSNRLGSGYQYFINPGALSRGSIAEEDVQRNPTAALVTFTRDNIDVKLIRLNAKPAEEVFLLAEHEKFKESQKKIGEFISSLSDLTESVASEDSFAAALSKMELENEVYEEVIAYLAKGEEALR